MRTYLTLSLSMLLLSCSDGGLSIPPSGPPGPTDIPIDQLLAIPETTLVDGRILVLSTLLWRDFQPICPPDGRPLIAVAHIDATDTAGLPPTTSSDALWIVYSNHVWKSYFTNESHPPYPPRPNRLEKIAREGPKWGPHVYVDVIVRILDGRGFPHFLRATSQWIDMTL
jgi:hypothetical protein